jgi:hypothetical protein
MGERVNIQYSVDIEDLGDEVCRLMCDAYENLNAVEEGRRAPTNNVLSLQTIKEIDGVRQKLADIDIRLGDAVNIINGYISYKSQMINQQEIAAQVDDHDRENGAEPPDYNTMTESLTSLQERIKQFKNEDEAVNQG